MSSNWVVFLNAVEKIPWRINTSVLGKENIMHIIMMSRQLLVEKSNLCSSLLNLQNQKRWSQGGLEVLSYVHSTCTINENIYQARNTHILLKKI